MARIADLAPRYRYARVKDASDTDAIRETLDAEPVAWLPGFLRMPAARRLKGSAPYEDRRVFAMDAASGFAARAGIVGRATASSTSAARRARSCCVSPRPWV